MKKFLALCLCFCFAGFLCAASDRETSIHGDLESCLGSSSVDSSWDDQDCDSMDENRRRAAAAGGGAADSGGRSGVDEDEVWLVRPEEDSDNDPIDVLADQIKKCRDQIDQLRTGQSLVMRESLFAFNSIKASADDHAAKIEELVLKIAALEAQNHMQQTQLEVLHNEAFRRRRFCCTIS